MIAKQDRVRPRTVEDLERKYRDVFDRRAMQQQQQAQGEDGITPHIGENGNWFLGTVDTGVPAKGKDGEPGKSGVGIVNIKKTGTLGLVDTYTITLTDGSTTTFTVTNGQDGVNIEGGGGEDGVGIKFIAKTGSAGLVDTYTITLTNDQTYTFTVTNGRDGIDGRDGTDGHTPYIQNGYWYINGVNTGVRAEGRDGSDGSDGTPFTTDETLSLTNGVLSVNTVNELNEETADYTLPITASAVNVTVGNINAILETI